MTLPPFNQSGDLPEGIHSAGLDEVLARFGDGNKQRRQVSDNLQRIVALARGTGKLARFLLFGSYVTAKSEPNDVDVILIMQDDFNIGACGEEAKALFDHQRATEEMGASIFWRGRRCCSRSPWMNSSPTGK